jgi:hypothetical protein
VCRGSDLVKSISLFLLGRYLPYQFRHNTPSSIPRETYPKHIRLASVSASIRQHKLTSPHKPNIPPPFGVRHPNFSSRLTIVKPLASAHHAPHQNTANARPHHVIFPHHPNASPQPKDTSPIFTSLYNPNNPSLHQSIQAGMPDGGRASIAQVERVTPPPYNQGQI